MKIKIGIICPSEIALRRFMPAISKIESFEYLGVAIAGDDEWTGNVTDEIKNLELEKAKKFKDNYGGKIYQSYSEMIKSNEIDAIYLPLPPALHYKWGKKALENNKHLLMEKPFTATFSETNQLISLAKTKNLAIHENYMFVYHSQLEWIKNKITDGAIGDIRLIRIDFGFPFRGASDFRYNKSLGGGALLDCGGYTIKLASLMLGDTTYISESQLNYKDEFDVDIYGSATLKNNEGLTAQVSFGMDNSYKCSLEIWGSNGSIYTNRILTAPEGFEPTIILKQGNNEEIITLSSDDTFAKSITFFKKCLFDKTIRISHYSEILKQAQLIEFMKGEG